MFAPLLHDPLGLTMLLLIAVGVLAAPLLVRRALRGDAISPARWRSPGVELLFLAWVLLIEDSVFTFENFGGVHGDARLVAHQHTHALLSRAATLSLLMMSVTVWTALCAAIGHKRAVSPERAATLRHGLVVSSGWSFVFLSQAAVFVSLRALFDLALAPDGPVAVIRRLRCLEWALAAMVVSLLVTWALAWRSERRGLWQIILLTLGIIGAGVWNLRAPYYFASWGVWSHLGAALELPYEIPQRPPGAATVSPTGLSQLCVKSGTRWRCPTWSPLGWEETTTPPPGTTFVLPQDTPLAEALRLNDGHPTLLVCAGPPRAGRWGLKRLFSPALASCAVLTLTQDAPELVIDAAPDWTVQQLVDAVNQSQQPAAQRVRVHWTSEPG
jgi:hypothetical protein